MRLSSICLLRTTYDGLKASPREDSERVEGVVEDLILLYEA